LRIQMNIERTEIYGTYELVSYVTNCKSAPFLHHWGRNK
jgi:hypothetical protein